MQVAAGEFYIIFGRTERPVSDSHHIMCSTFPPSKAVLSTRDFCNFLHKLSRPSLSDNARIFNSCKRKI